MSAKQSQALSVVFASQALRELDAIWNWNEQKYTRFHAARYIDFLRRHIEALSRNHSQGSAVESRPDLHYIQIRQRNRGHGHIVVYRVDSDMVHVLHVFHTAQDWPTRLESE